MLLLPAFSTVQWHRNDAQKIVTMTEINITCLHHTRMTGTTIGLENTMKTEFQFHLQRQFSS